MKTVTGVFLIILTVTVKSDKYLATREAWKDVWMFPALAEGQQVIKTTHNPSRGLPLTLLFVIKQIWERIMWLEMMIQKSG